MLKGLAKITRMPLKVGLPLSAVLLLAWIPDLLGYNTGGGNVLGDAGSVAVGNVLGDAVVGNVLGNAAETIGGMGSVVGSTGNGMDWREVVATMVLSLINAMGLWLCGVRTGLIRSKDGLPVWLYMLAITAMPAAHDCWRGQVAVAILMVVLWMQYATYKSDHAAESAFLGTLLLCVGSMAVPDLLWMVPLSWLSYLWLQSFSLRVVSATLMGVLTYGVYTAIAVVLFGATNPYEGLFERQWIFNRLSVWNAATACVWIGLGLVWLVMGVLNMWYEADKRRMGIVLVGSGLLWASVCLLFATPNTHLLPVFVMLYSGQALLYLRQHESIGRGIGYIVYIAAAICLIMNWELGMVSNYELGMVSN